MTDALIPLHALKGRGAATRLPHRFERETRNAFDDGWGTLEDAAAEPLPPLATEVRFEDVKSVLSENDSPDIPLRSLAQSLSRLRARLHLLLCAADAQLPRIFRRDSTSKPS